MVRFNMQRTMKQKRHCICGKKLQFTNKSDLCFWCKRKILFINNLNLNKTVKLINGEIIIK